MSASQPESTEATGAFVRLGPAEPCHPVILAVPHAGRAYSAALIADARVPLAVLEGLEDRLADLLVADAVGEGFTAFVARRPRAWIDLNRGERELDRTMIVPPPPASAVAESARVRGGLGLLPRRASGGAELWRRSFTRDELDSRIAADHRPWHAALAGTLAAARARFGIAILLDCHSMPSLPRTRGGAAGAQLVIGDRHGQSADLVFRDLLAGLARRAGLRVSANLPYAGGHALERHGAPEHGCHALQIELDRALYLAPDLHAAGAGLPAMTALVADMARALSDAAIAAARPIAAE